MKFKNTKRWKLTPELEGLLFFAQRMDELLWDFTLDTYKPTSLNSPSLCKELLSLIENVKSNLIDKANIKPILEELVWSIQNDQIAKSLLDAPIEHYTTYNENDLDDLGIKVEVLGRTLESYRYLDACYESLCKNIIEKPKNKKAIEKTASNLITTLINMGVSKKYLYSRNYDFFFSTNGPEISSAEEIEVFLTSIYPYSHDFTIYGAVSNLINQTKDSIKHFGIKIIEELPNEVSQFAANINFKKNENEEYVEISDIRGFDMYSAQEKAISTLDLLSDLYTLFHHRTRINWQATVIITQCCQDQIFTTTVSQGAMQKPFDMKPEKASKELNRFIRNIALKGKSFEKFNQAADLHGICVSSDVVENQLVNLWTALETLIPSRASASKINNILDAMTPFLMTSYLERIVQRLLHDLITWKRWKTRSILNKVSNSTNRSLLQKTVILLCTKENENLRNELYSELGDFHLLRHRTYSLSQLLSSPQLIKEALASHETKVRWQIRRIYRTRNLIVHSGDKPSYIHALIENGHDYLDQIIFGTMRLSCGDYRAETLEQVFKISQIQHQQFKAKLDSINEFTSENCQFICSSSLELKDFTRSTWN